MTNVLESRRILGSFTRRDFRLGIGAQEAVQVAFGDKFYDGKSRPILSLNKPELTSAYLLLLGDIYALTAVHEDVKSVHSRP